MNPSSELADYGQCGCGLRSPLPRAARPHDDHGQRFAGIVLGVICLIITVAAVVDSCELNQPQPSSLSQQP